jgi:hypothetical protein
MPDHFLDANGNIPAPWGIVDGTRGAITATGLKQIRSKLAQQNQDQHDHEHEAKPATAIVAGSIEGAASEPAEASKQCDN